MTTIAWDGKTLAADRRVSGCGGILITCKIIRAPDGRLIGVSGRASACEALRQWMLTKSGDPPVPLRDEAWGDIIEIEPDGAVYFWGEWGRFLVLNDEVAIGSGQQFARAAMACGKSAAEAVEIAALFDEQTGDGVDVLRLEPCPPSS